MFRKKEPLTKLAKSVLKHRIQTLTGQNMSVLENQLGFSLVRDGVGMNADQMRTLAHLLILEANDMMMKEEPNEAAASTSASIKAGRKRRSMMPIGGEKGD